MARLFIIADDFTGAMDSGIHFASKGASTLVVTDSDYDFSRVAEEVQVFVMALESRHFEPDEAFTVVRDVVQRALNAGFTHIYKKTDSGLRGNIGAELSAVLDASGADAIHFAPAFPKMGRVTRGGIHYVSGIPVSEGVFATDPFNPVRHSGVADIIHEQSEVPVVLHSTSRYEQEKGIQVYDAETDEDLLNIAKALGADGLRFASGCAGFAEAVAQVLNLTGMAPVLPKLIPNFLVMCGSVNPVTLEQMKVAEEHGFSHIHLTPEQKLGHWWLESKDCAMTVKSWLKTLNSTHRCILDVNDLDGSDATECYAKEYKLSTEELRIGIAENLSILAKKLFDLRLDATILCTGGDTFIALLRRVGITELRPVIEMATGVVLTAFDYGGKEYHIMSKSGAFGEPDLFCKLAEQICVNA